MASKWFGEKNQEKKEKKLKIKKEKKEKKLKTKEERKERKLKTKEEKKNEKKKIKSNQENSVINGNNLEKTTTIEDNQTDKSKFFVKLKRGLSKTKEILTTDIDELFTGNRVIDDNLLEELEELLITSDIGIETSVKLMEIISDKVSDVSNSSQLKNLLKQEILTMLNDTIPKQKTVSVKPYVIMVIGVNGVGKTTTVGKLAAKFTSQGKKVIISAADTFRAAAVEQLTIWGERAGATVIRHRDNADPAAVAYDSVEAAIARKADVVLIDTAGRLHTKVNLMEELAKIKRSIEKKLHGAPHETLIVLDATTGQNALSQAELFNKSINLTSIALTKLDGTAKGGIVISINNSLKIPIKYIGVGEQIDDLQDFNPTDFVNALL